MIIVPSQAQDRHRSKLKNKVRFLVDIAERLAWETTFIDQLETVLAPGLSAVQEAAGCGGSCGKQLRFVGAQAASVVVTVQVLPVRYCMPLYRAQTMLLQLC